MKKILSVIGGFFVKIWRWIKETAWVQPLLIVGIIFGVIFSIPSIVTGVRNINEKNKSAETYYKKYKVSLTGADNSPADKLMKEIKDNKEGTSSTLNNQKFFLVFVSQDCGACQNAREAFEYIQGEGKKLVNGEKIAIKTIFRDETFTEGKEDWKKEGTTDVDNAAKIPFEAFLLRNELMIDLFAATAQLSEYAVNNLISEDEISKIEESVTDVSKFRWPTIVLIDFTTKDGVKGPGVKEVFIYNETILPGATKLDKGQYLADAWLGTGMFAPNYSR